MVTFSLPGESDYATPHQATPRARPPLPFAKRAYANSPLTGGAKRLGTPQTTSARKLLIRDEGATTSSLGRSSLSASRNIFRSSTVSDSPPTASFAPSIPESTPRKMFAPGATPEPSRTFRASTANPTPRGVAQVQDDKSLFTMRITEPPKELDGEKLTRRIPQGWDSKGSIYADQYCADLCPPELDDEQRRQWFCVLDLRRLKYTADEIFARKDWRLNVMNFAKEYEKSRSIVLLRYGLYEFKNVKPSKELMRRWRREHGLPEPEEEEGDDANATPTKSSSAKKRKANNDDGSSTSATSKSKRRNTEMDIDEDDERASRPTTAPVTSPVKNKRKASPGGDSDTQPSKLAKPSQASSIFQKIANKPATPAPASPAPNAFASPKPNPFASAKPAGSSLARSVFSNLKAGTELPPPSGNIFGHLSDTGSAKNSGGEADAESETDSEQDEEEEEDSPEAAQSDGPSVAASGAADNASQAGSSSLFAAKSTFGSGLATAGSSAPGTRESTPGPSLFDRVTKNAEGQAVRSGDESEKPAPVKPTNQTWNPTTTPLKFAPGNAASTADSQPKSLFGAPSAPSSNSSGSLFGAKPSAAANMFASAAAKASDETSKEQPAARASESEKSGAESDKENAAKPATSLFGAASTPSQMTTGSLFQSKPTAAEPKKDSEAPKPAANPFGAVSKPAEPAASPAIQPSSTLFGAKPPESTSSESAKPASIFGAAPPSGSTTPGGSTLFGAKPAGGASTMFGSTASAPSSNLFGAKSTNGGSENKAPESEPAKPAATPSFSFGSASGSQSNGTSQLGAKPIFGAPKSPADGTAPTSLFSGSPMKQDEASPAKKPFASGNNGGSSTPLFSFGSNGGQTSNSTNMFGNNSTPAAPAAPIAPNVSFSFGAGGNNNASHNDNSNNSGNAGFSFGSTVSAGSSFNNPFSSGNTGTTQSAPSSFNFGASTQPASGTSAFQFGGGSGASASQSAAPMFGGQSNNNSAPMFGGSNNNNNNGGAPSFSFTSATTQPATTSGMFGSQQSNGAPQGFAANLQPPTGGASTGTNTPLSLGGVSSLATTPAAPTPANGTPEPAAAKSAPATNGEADDDEDPSKNKQISLDEVDESEEVLHEVRAKVLKFKPADQSEGDDAPKSKSPWTTQGVGALRVLKNKETNNVRLLLRAEPRGHVALNRSLLPDVDYKADSKYVKIATSNETGDGLETYMLQVKTNDLAKDLATALEEHKKLNAK